MGQQRSAMVWVIVATLTTIAAGAADSGNCPRIWALDQILPAALRRLYRDRHVSKMCRSMPARLSVYEHVSFHQNDGLTLDVVSDNSVDLVFSFDSLVHCEIDVL